MKGIFIVILLCMLYSGEGYIIYAQEDGELITDTDNTLKKNERKNLERMVDYEIGFFNKIFSDKQYTKLDADILIFSDYGEYLAYQRKIGKTIYTRSPGFYSPDDYQIVICKDKFEKTFLTTCYHELSHFFLMSRAAHVPVWLNEGIATYMEGVKISSKDIKHVIGKYFVSRVKTMVTLKDINLREFVIWSGREFSQTSFSYDGYGYAIAHCMIHVMMDNEEVAFNVIKAVCNDKIETIKAFDLYYAGGFDQFEKDFFSRYK